MNLGETGISSTQTTTLLAAATLVCVQVVPIDCEKEGTNAAPTYITGAITSTSMSQPASILEILGGHDASEITDRAARIRALLDEDSPALTEAERVASVEWVWQPSRGLVRQS